MDARPVNPRRLAFAGLAAAFLMLAAGGALWLQRDRSGAPAIGGPFALIDENGRSVTDRDWRGKYTLIYFGYTYCPDACPTTLNEIAGALDALGSKADRLQPLFISVDPQRDTPAVLKQFVTAISPRIVGLTGDPAQIDKVAKEFKVYYSVHKTGEGAQDYTVDHSSILYLMGPDGRFVAFLPADQASDKMAAALAKHMP